MKLMAFDMNCVGHIQQGMWRHPRDRSTEYGTLAHWTGLARTLERGLFDGLFLADVLGAYDVHGGSADAALEGAVQVPLGDPALLVPAMATVTTHLGFAITANTAYEPPALFARRMSTLDALTGGRVGWNVVTGYLDSAARAMGLPAQAAHDDRYDAADETLDLLYALWEGSWADDAVLADRATGRFADPARVRPVRHAGPRLRSEGIHLCAPTPQRTPVLFQAGSSGRGRAFAARHAECVFVNATSRPAVAALVSDLRAGTPRPLTVLAGATVVVAETAALAQAKLADYQRYASTEAALVHASASMGVDFAAYAPADPIRMVSSNAITSNLQALADRPAMTKARFAAELQLGGRQTPIVGDPATVADALCGWVADTGVDGFILARTVTPECFEDFVDLVVPELQRRGAFKTAYAPGTLREKLGAPDPRLAAPHPAAAQRWYARTPA